jgi:Tfp pilus assembly protein PilF
MNNIIITFFIAYFTISSSPVFGHGGNFPGKGDHEKWYQATKLFNEAIRLDKQKETEPALAKYRAAIRTYPWDSDFYDNLGHLLEEDKNDVTAANNVYLQGINAEPSVAHIRISYAGFLFNQKKFTQSKVMLDKAARCKQITDKDRSSIAAARNLLQQKLNRGK